jgi:hypothetical protein
VEPRHAAPRALRGGQYQLGVEGHGLLALEGACRQHVVQDTFEDLVARGVHVPEPVHERDRLGRQGLRRRLVVQDDRIGRDVEPAIGAPQAAIDP